MALSEPVARVTLTFSTTEYFALVLFSLASVACLGGGSLLNAFVSLLIGLLIAAAGVDGTYGADRFSFGFDTLQDGSGTPAASIAAPSGLVFWNNRLRRDIAMAAPLSWIGMDRSKPLRYIPYGISISDQIYREGNKHMKLSARNVLKGKIVDIARASTMTRVSLDIGGTIVNAAITTVAVDDLKLAVGKEAYAIVDATNVMVGID